MLHMFHCCECQQSKLQYNPDGFGAVGHAQAGGSTLPVCYECCGKIDRAAMLATGRATLYLVERAKDPDGYSHYIVKNWPGSLVFDPWRVRIGRHNMAGKRYDSWFNVDGQKWHGVTYGDETQIHHCRRLKPPKVAPVFRCGACDSTANRSFDRCAQCGVPDQCYQVEPRS